MEKYKPLENMNTSTQWEDLKEHSPYKCDICKDIGFTFFTQNGYEFAEFCQCRRVNESKDIIKKSGMAEAFKNKNFGNFKEDENTRQAKATCRDYVKSYKGHSLLLSGNVGTGKTHLAMAIANNLLHRYVPVKFASYREFITDIKQSITDKEYYSTSLNAFKNSEVLLMDDLFKGKITPADINVMFELIDFRYCNNKSTIITTEKSIDELIAIDEAVGSRIYEMSKGFTILMTGANYRMR